MHKTKIIVKKQLYLLWIPFLLLIVYLGIHYLESKDESTPKSVQIFAMDTMMDLTAYGKEATQALEKAEVLIRQYEKMFSATEEESDISKINENAGGWTEVEEEVANQIKKAIEISENSDGAFDISVYPIVKAWGFTTDVNQVPEQSLLDSILEFVDYKKIKIEGKKVYLEEGMAMDLGAIAKGYTSNAITNLLKKNGVSSAIVSLGGNVQTLGTKPDGSDWTVGITDPNEPDRMLGSVSLANMAAITSGGYQRYFEQDGVRYHHIMNPVTGYPSDSGLIATTILCEDGMLADGLSTTLFVMGLDKAKEYWKQYGGFDAIFITEDNRIVITKNLKERFQLFETETSYTIEYIE